MQFKHPEILYFLFLLVIPILVHLFQLRRFKKEYFTNVDFLKELSIQTRKSSKLKKWLLLATRLLLLTALIFAFAQPFFRAADSNNVTNEMFIILDNSFSMQAKGKKGELLKRAIEDLRQHAPENQTFSLLTNSQTFWNTDIKSIQNELQQMEYSALPFDPESLMAKVNARKSPYNKDIVVITDAVGINQKQLSAFDGDFKTFFVVPKAEQTNNVSIDSVYMIQALDNFYEIAVQVSAYGDAINEVPIALYNNEKLIAKTLATFENRKKTLKFTIPKADFNGYASIEDNGLEYDDTFYFSISKPEKTDVLSIGESAKSTFLSKIYTAEEFNYYNYPVRDLDYNILEKQDAIVLNELEEIPQALQTTLKAFVEKGGNVILIPSSANKSANINSFLSNFGKIQFGSLQENSKLVSKIAFSHPLYVSVFEKKIENFQYPETKTSFNVAASTPAILSFEDQSQFLTALQNPTSAVYVFTAPINKDNSNFQNSPLIVPTFYNMAQSVSKTGISSIFIGASQPLFVEASLAKDEIVNIRNSSDKSDEKFIPVQHILNNKVKLTFNDYPSHSGNFGIYKQDELLRNTSFNYTRTEGNLTDVNESTADYNVIDSIETVFDTLQNDRTNNEIWKWFVILTLLFLVTELFIQKFVR